MTETEASSTSSLPPLDNLQIQLHDGQKMEAAVGYISAASEALSAELVAYASPRAASRGSAAVEDSAERLKARSLVTRSKTGSRVAS